MDFPIPGNDDAIRAVRLYTEVFADMVINARQAAQITPAVTEGAQDLATTTVAEVVTAVVPPAAVLLRASPQKQQQPPNPKKSYQQ